MITKNFFLVKEENDLALYYPAFSSEEKCEFNKADLNPSNNQIRYFTIACIGNNEFQIEVSYELSNYENLSEIGSFNNFSGVRLWIGREGELLIIGESDVRDAKVRNGYGIQVEEGRQISFFVENEILCAYSSTEIVNLPLGTSKVSKTCTFPQE